MTQNQWWKNHHWRFIQTNLREIDMQDIDAKQYVQDMLSFEATVAMINTSGIIASYPTKLPYHYQSPYLTGDSLKTIIDECHAHGIRVMARTDFSKVRRVIYEQHPDWAFVDTDGQIVDYEGDVHVCINSDYQQIHALEIIRETLTELDVDGIFFNMGGYVSGDYSGRQHGICQCGSCRRRFREKTGYALPRQADLADPVYRAYLVFKRETTTAYNRKVCEFIKSIRPEILINHDTYTEDSGFIRQESNTAWDRALPHWQYSGSENTKWVRGSFPTFISSNTTVDFIDFPSRHVAVSPWQQALRLYQGLANGGMPDYYLIGRLDNHRDRSGFEPIRQAFQFHARHQELFRDLRADCRTVILAGDHWGGHGDGDMQEFFGLYRALTEAHHLFDVMLLSQVVRQGLAKYQTIILPGCAALAAETATIIDQAVHQGATLISSGLTGRRDERLDELSENALACLRGVQPLAERPARGAYFQLDDHAWTEALNDTDLITIDGDYFYAEYPANAERYGRLIPPQPYGPPERCYSLYPATDYPAAARLPYGQGTVILLPWQPGRLFQRQGYANTAAFLSDVLSRIAELQPIGGNLPPMVETTLLHRDGEDFRLLCLVNGSGHFGNSFYKPLTLTDLRVQIPFQAKTVRSVTRLSDGEALPFSWQEERLTIDVDRLEAFDALLIR